MLDTILHHAINGLQSQEIALTAVRAATGLFFFCSGMNKLFNPARHASLRENLTKNKIPAVQIMEWWVPFWEFAAGAMLTAGLLTAFSAGVLFIICTVACCCEAKKRVEAYGPINKADVVADYLYLPEVLYLLLLAVFMFDGRTAYSIDALLF